jgi:hypothetical protein
MKKRVFPGQAPAPRMVDLTEPDGTTLQATYFGRWASLVRKCSCSPVRRVTARSGRKSRRGTECFDARLSQGFFGDGADQRKRILSQSPSSENYFDGSSSQFGGDVEGVRNDGQILKAAQGARDRRSSGAGVEDDDLTFLHHRSRAAGDAEFFPAVELSIENQSAPIFGLNRRSEPGGAGTNSTRMQISCRYILQDRLSSGGSATTHLSHV